MVDLDALDVRLEEGCLVFPFLEAGPCFDDFVGFVFALSDILGSSVLSQPAEAIEVRSPSGLLLSKFDGER